jgi:hypothetical protein
MVKFHGCPIGGTIDEVQRFLPNRHLLVSYHHPDQIESVAQLSSSFIIDNGAFSFWKSGKGEVDFSGYHAFVQTWANHPKLDFCIIPDKIAGTEDDNINLVTRWLRTGSDVEGVPVFHFNETLDYLDYLVNNFRTVALGSSSDAEPNSQSWWATMSKIMQVACNKAGRPKCRLHGLRMLNPDIFTRLPLTSADSTNVAVNSGSIARFGQYVPASRSLRAAVIAERIEIHPGAQRWQEFNQGSLF